VVADHIAAAEGVHANFPAGAGADVPDPAVGDILGVGGAGFLIEDLQQRAGGAGGRVDFMAVVHFGHLDVETILAEDAGGMAGEPE